MKELFGFNLIIFRNIWFEFSIFNRCRLICNLETALEYATIFVGPLYFGFYRETPEVNNART